jgi:hypothetical protein
MSKAGLDMTVMDAIHGAFRRDLDRPSVMTEAHVPDPLTVWSYESGVSTASGRWSAPAKRAPAAAAWTMFPFPSNSLRARAAAS